MSFNSYAVVALLIIFSIQPSLSIYCDEDDCYDLLGVSMNANSSEIKKAYYKLSLKHYPDKNPNPESKKLFLKIANAYEILKDEVTRGKYDYAIEHPEEVFYNTARYYHAYYGHKTDPRAVLVGLLLVLSGMQYLNQWTRLLTWSRGHRLIKNKLKALELERTGAMPSKKKGGYKINKMILAKSLNCIKGVEKPSMWGLLGVHFILLPYTLGKLILWHGSWYWRYKINKTSYSWEDASYLTRRALGAPSDSWENLDDLTKKDLINRRLWMKSNLESYLSDMRKESKRRR